MLIKKNFIKRGKLFRGGPVIQTNLTPNSLTTKSLPVVNDKLAKSVTQKLSGALTNRNPQNLSKIYHWKCSEHSPKTSQILQYTWFTIIFFDLIDDPINMFLMSSCIATSRLVHNDGYIQKPS